MADPDAATLQSSTSGFKIYTKSGDSGTSQLFSGDRLPKDNEVFHALGDVDELNCAVGLAREFSHEEDEAESIKAQLEAIQSRLFDVGAAVATPIASASEAKQQRTAFSAEHTAQLEAWIDQMSAGLPPLRNFILPSGNKTAAALHMARAVAIYINRLSDYLFVAARVAAKGNEVIWRKA